MKSNKTFAALFAVVALVIVAGGGYAIGHHTSVAAQSSTKRSSVSTVADKASATGHNAVDVMFAQMMTPHHAQAIDMAKLATTRASSPAVKTLAAKIEAAQQPEIDSMTGWLKDWNASSSMSMSHGMDGMMSDSDMSSLQNMTGAAFDKMFLQMMIQHHDGAIKMAKSELAGGKNAEALGLATSIEVTQQAQVRQMKQLLKS